MMGHNEYSGTQLYMGGRRRGNDSFPYKKVTFCFNHTCDLDADSRSRGVESFFLKSMASSRRNRDLPDAPVIKPIGMVICPK
jgi:hypothetical protein